MDIGNTVVLQKNKEEDGKSAQAVSPESPVTEMVNCQAISEEEVNKSDSCPPVKDGELESASEKSTIEAKNNDEKVKNCVETAKRWEIEVKALQDVEILSNFNEDGDEPVQEDIDMISDKTDTPNVEISSPEICLALDDSPECPYSPYSNNEADMSEERVLMIDESVEAEPEIVADSNASHTSNGTLDSDNADESIPKVVNTVEEKGTTEEESSKEINSNDRKAPTVSTLSSIEESIERCIANYSCGTTEEEPYRQSGASSPTVLKKRRFTSKPFEGGKFPRNYGFKIITNKIDLCPSPKGTFSTMPLVWEDSPTPLSNPVKIIKIQGKSLLDTSPLVVSSEEGTEPDIEEKDRDTTSPAVLTSVKIAFQKSTEETSEKVTSKERPAIGLKVRNVESINAAIGTVKAPLCQVPSDGTNSVPDSNAVEKASSDKESTLQKAENGKESPSITCRTTLRPIAPKCQPIAANDQQAIKMIKDLIKLPTVPVYVPDVSSSKYFNGRLHLCHGCGDRFVLLKSLLEHQNRRSCVIKYQCLRCDSTVLCFFNRCELIRHLYNHNQTLTNVMLHYHLTVERLPPQNTGIFDVKICQECKVFLNVPLPDHMQCADPKEKTGADLALKCQWCSLLLPTKCAYQAHRRMHFLQAPHVCPECGDISPDLTSFNIHINSVCFHTSKRSLFQCNHCQTKMYDARKLERHIRTKHIRDVFKCDYCFVACFSLQDLVRHKQVVHQEKVDEEPKDDDDTGLKYAFHLCDMCPNRLIRRVRVGQHVWDHTYTNGDITYVYECRKCKISFDSKDFLSAHASMCTAAGVASNAEAFTAVIANGGDTLIPQPLGITSEVELPMVVEVQTPVTDSVSGSEVLSDLTESVTMPLQTPYQEEESDVMEIDGADPPLPKSPTPQQIISPGKQPVTQPVIQKVTQPVSQTIIQKVTQPSSNVVLAKKKKKATKKSSPVKIDLVTPESPKDNTFNSFEQDSFVDGDSPEVEEDGTMEVVLNCLDCGANLTSELGSYCTLCEQRKEAGDAYEMPPASLVQNVAETEPSENASSDNLACRICHAHISDTCDMPAIKKHFVSEHKDLFIAALQTGMMYKKDGSSVGKPNFLFQYFTASKVQRRVKKSPVASLSKFSLKKNKKTLRKPVWESDTDDDSLPSRGEKRPQQKRRKSYSPVFPALEQGMVASDGKSSETNDDVRTCYKCSFKSADKEEFMTHVATHKLTSKDLQCPACGMCFVVRPTLEKHLLVIHGVQKPEEYLLEHGFPAVEKVSNELDVDMSDVNQCKVCHMKFDTATLLDKHFRTHGSAFLLSKQFRPSS